MTDAEPQFAEEAFFEEGDEVSAYREASVRYCMAIKRVFMFALGYKGGQLFAFHCAAMAMGFTELLGFKTHKELARHHRVTKSHVNKTVLEFQAQMAIDPLPGQRTTISRQHFSTARKSQLSTK